jgi:hypothetical protein
MFLGSHSGSYEICHLLEYRLMYAIQGAISQRIANFNQYNSSGKQKILMLLLKSH